MITYEDFSKLEIRIGHIISAEVVAGSDKLLQLMVEVGEAAPRQIISGIKKYFPDPQVLVGRSCPFLLNIEPREIYGLESQGMILASDHDNIFALLEPSQMLPPGTIVH